jgi:miniconductance mechanosensitive channel
LPIEENPILYKVEMMLMNEKLQVFLLQSEMEAALFLLCLVLAALFANFVVKRMLLFALERLLNHIPFGQDEELRRYGVIPRLANIVPALVVDAGLSFAKGIPADLKTILQNITDAFIIITISMALVGILSILDTLYHRRPKNDLRPIKGYVQVGKIVVFAIATIFVIATLLDTSPFILLSGLGAMTAVLMLVFQDTLLSLVAGMQISSSDMIRVGDWVEMPELGADGDVIEISLYTIKVQNFDKTITTIPVRKLVSDSFKNWSGMQKSGGRRIKCSVQLDQNSICFLTEDGIDRLKKIRLLNNYLERKNAEVSDWNLALGEDGFHQGNTRRLTNLGTFRAYLLSYLRAHGAVQQGMTLMVRQLDPSPQGLKIEIYCFTNTTEWSEYEGIKSDILEHILAILPEFDLFVFQDVGSNDVKGKTDKEISLIG